MFTGIVETVGEVAATGRQGQNGWAKILTKNLDLTGAKPGDSLACDGCCLTITRFSEGTVTVDISHETLERTTLGSWGVGTPVNLELAMKVGDRLGGHIVQGHVDGTGEIAELSRSGETLTLWIKTAPEIMRYIAAKGSISVDGVTLTVNELGADRFRLTLIPHTIERTTLIAKRVGDGVNLENDIISKYVERLLFGESTPAGNMQSKEGLTWEKLKANGFIK